MTLLKYTETIELVKMTCGECGIVFGMPDTLRDERKEDGGAWYCPNGHSRVFRESDVQKLTKQLAAERARADQAASKATTAELLLVAQKKETARISKRAARGVCPCCKRSFASTRMHAHMKTKHPEFSP